MGVFSKELYERGHEDYWQASVALLMDAQAGRLSPVPQKAKDVGFRLLERAADPTILREDFVGVAEAFGVAYRFATEEAWEDLDRAVARRLIDNALRRVREEHLAAGQDPLDPSNPDHRVHYTLLGLVGTHHVFEGLRDYVVSRAAYRRLESLDELQLRMGVETSRVPRRHAARFMDAQLVAWNAGRMLGILAVLGELVDEQASG